MKIEKLVIAFVAGVLVTGLLCTEKVVDSTPAPDAKLAIGTWYKQLPLVPIMPETLNVTLIIKQDSLFTLNLTKRTSVQLYKSEGTWTTTDDSIYLHSTKCLVIDTVADPDTLKNLGDSLCSVPIPLKLPVNDMEWNIETRKLSVMLSGFPLPPGTLDGLMEVIPILALKSLDTEL